MSWNRLQTFRYALRIFSGGVSGSISSTWYWRNTTKVLIKRTLRYFTAHVRTSKGFRLAYLAPGLSSLSICCTPVSTASLFSIFFTWGRHSITWSAHNNAIRQFDTWRPLREWTSILTSLRKSLKASSLFTGPASAIMQWRLVIGPPVD